jgi:hypothetical protein
MIWDEDTRTLYLSEDDKIYIKNIKQEILNKDENIMMSPRVIMNHIISDSLEIESDELEFLNFIKVLISTVFTNNEYVFYKRNIVFSLYDKRSGLMVYDLKIRESGLRYNNFLFDFDDSTNMNYKTFLNLNPKFKFLIRNKKIKQILDDIL